MISISAATCYLSGTSLHLVRGGLQPKLFIVQSLEEASVRLICSVFTLFFEVKLFSGNWGRKWGRQAGRQEERRQGGPEEGRICAFRHVCVCVLSCVWPFETPLDFTPWPPLSTGFSRQEYWRGLPCPPPGHLPDPGIETESLLHWQAGSYHWVRSLSTFSNQQLREITYGPSDRREGRTRRREKRAGERPEQAAQVWKEACSWLSASCGNSATPL